MRVGVKDGKITATITDWPTAAKAAGMSAEKAAQDLGKAIDNLNKDLARGGLKVTGVEVVDGKLQITSAPKDAPPTDPYAWTE